MKLALLTEEEKVKACQLSVQAGADYVKTSTGFSTGGATVEDIKLMRKTVGPESRREGFWWCTDCEDAKAMIEAGATRIGASSGIAIVRGIRKIKVRRVGVI